MTIDTDIISSKEMEQISALKTASDILLLLEKKEDNINDLVKSDASAIYLDGVQDPGNVGTIIRIADWFGVDAVIRSEESADFFNPKVVQSSMGSMANTLLITSDIETVSSLKKPIYGTYMKGAEIKKIIMESGCLLYTSDAADERSSVDLGGRRIIKKKKNKRRHGLTINKIIK